MASLSTAAVKEDAGSLCIQAAERNNRRTTCIMHFHTTGNSTDSVRSFACSQKWDASRRARYRGESTSVHNVHTRTWVSLQVGLLASLLHRVVPINEKWLIRSGSAPGYRTVGLLFRDKSNRFCFLQFQLAWLSNNKSCYWHPELFLLGAGRLRNGRCLQGSGTQGSLLLTGAKKPEIALPTERCTISRQQCRERNGLRYKTSVHIQPTTRQTTVTCLTNLILYLVTVSLYYVLAVTSRQMRRLNFKETYTAHFRALATAAYRGCKIYQLRLVEFEPSNPASRKH